MACKYIYENKEYTKEEFYKFVGDNLVEKKSVQKYEKVLFPSGNTSMKIEGHSTLEEFKKQKEYRINAYLLPRKKAIEKGEVRKNKEDGFYYLYYNAFGEETKILMGATSDSREDTIENAIKPIDNEINQLKQELERVETEGFGALKPIYNFYENTVSNILNKTYGKENVKQVTDEYGNTWNEVNLKDINNINDTITKEDLKQLKDCI